MCLGGDSVNAQIAARTRWTSTYVRSTSQPLVGPLFDSNFDGELDSADRVAIVLISRTDAELNARRIHALDARGDAILWSYGDRAPDHSILPAMADLTGQHSVNVLFVDSERHLVALHADGALAWVSSVPVAPGNQSLLENAISVADLNGDGRAEILIGPSVFDSSGQLLWQFPDGANALGQSLALDLDGDGRMEVLYRDQVRDADGALLFETPSTADAIVNHAFFAPARLSGASRPDVVISESTNRGIRLTAMTADGQQLWQLTNPAVRYAGPPLVGDFKGNGQEQVFLPATGQMFQADGTVLWDIGVLRDWSPRSQKAATAADIDGDGQLEILVTGNGRPQIWSGVSGALRWVDTSWSSSVHYAAIPVLVDLFGDGRPLLVANGSGIRTYEPVVGQWQADSRVFNQAAFARDRVRDDLTIPGVVAGAQPQPLRVQTRGASGQLGADYLSDLRVSAPYGRVDTRVQQLSVDIVNRGTARSLPFTVRLYRDAADEPANLIGTLDGSALLPAQSVTLSLTGLTPEELGETEVFAWLMPSADERECEVRNNLAAGRVSQISVADHGGLEDSQRWVVAVNESIKTPRIVSTAPLTAIEKQPYAYTVQGESDHIGDLLSYSLVQAPAGAMIHPHSGRIEWTPAWGQTGQQNFYVRVTSLNGRTVNQSWAVQVAASNTANTPPSIVSQPVTGAAAGEVYRYAVLAEDADGDVVTYHLLASPSGMWIDERTGLILWIPTSAPAAPVDITVEARDSGGATATQSYQVTVLSTPNQPPEFTNLPALQATVDEPYSYTATVSDPDGDPLVTELIEAPEGVRWDAGTHTLTWTPTVDQLGEQAFVIEARDNRGGDTRLSFTVYVNDPTQNQPPAFTTTPTTTLILGQTYTYTPQASDPDDDPVTLELTVSPQGASLDGGVLTWTPDAIGSGQFQLTATDGRGGVATQTFTVTVQEDGGGGGTNQPPLIDSVPVVTAVVDVTYNYPVAAHDPDGDTLSFSLISAPTGMSVDAASGLITWTPTAAQLGPHPVVVRASDGQTWVQQHYTVAVTAQADELVVTISIDPPVIAPGESTVITVGSAGGSGPVTVSLTVNGQPLPLDAQGQVVFSATEVGVYVLEATASDGTTTVTHQSQLTISEDGGAGEAPQVSLSAPVLDQEITAPTDVIGSVADDDLDHWSLYVLEKGAPTSEAREIARGTENVTEAVLGQFDPTLLLNGQYTILLQAWDRAGNTTATSVVVRVTGDMKVGHFAITFEDLSVDLAGIPIAVTRTYDTRQRHRDLDFGFGWSIDYQNVAISESRRIGFSWELNEYRNGLFSDWCVEPNGNPVVTVRLPDGAVETFHARAEPECTSLVPTVDVHVAFDAVDGTDSTLEATDYGLLKLVNGHLVDISAPNTPIDPDTYRLTTHDGMVYELDQHFGIRRIIEPDGESITYADTGITHSQGYAVAFERDADGRIEALVTPDGRRVEYTYTDDADLETITDLVGNLTRNEYNEPAFPHYLSEIIDPRGIRATRMEYDAQGRLEAIIDADGHRIEYTHDIAGRIETVRDRNGHATVYVYDDHGYVLSETNALGETITRTYDGEGNVLTDTNGEGETTTRTYDARGNLRTETNAEQETTTYTYNAKSQLETQQDPTGLVVLTNTYNSRSLKLLTTADAMGHTTTFHWDTGVGGSCSTGASRGYTDAENNRLTIQPLCAGPFAHLPRYQIDTRGVRTDYTYDHQHDWRLIAETTTGTDENGQARTLVTGYDYDDAGRVTKTTYPDGSFTRTEYNAIGQVAWEEDELGRRTTYTYDARGQSETVTYPDGTVEVTGYDANGNVASRTDRRGLTTRYEYDAANRLERTIHPDTHLVRNEYDRAGRLAAVIDERGYRTEYGYDDAGRRTSVRDPLGFVTRYDYDAQGRQSLMTDATGAVTEYRYDAAGRRIRTIFDDRHERKHGYDGLGRKTSETDEDDHTTIFDYDAAGNLEAVTDALGQRTEYTYDEQGNRRTQTDAQGHLTRWGYDARGRTTSRTLPMGQRERFTYDVAGQLKTHTDFLGRTIGYDYDPMGRETLRDYPGDADVTFTYTASGQLKTLTDGRGTTTYHHDDRDRLARIDYPDGQWIDYDYDAAGHRSLVRTPHGTTGFGHDALGRLARITDAQGETIIGYTPVGTREQVNYPNGISTTYGYDTRHRLKRLVTRNAVGATLLGLTYALNPTGTRAAIHEDAGRSVTYTYDALQRLETETVSDPVLGNRQVTWTYDAVGNRRTETRDGQLTTYTYDANDRLSDIQAPGGTTTYTYDANGNTETETAPGGLTTYAWNEANRLIGAMLPGGSALSYTYDPHGIRQSATVDGQTTRYLVDPNRDYAEVIAEVDQTSNSLIATYTHGDDLISQTRGGLTSYAHADGLGSVRVLTDPSGTTTDSYVYEAFGEVEDRQGASENPYQFTGEPFDTHLNQTYLRARYYDAQVGRFTAMDTWKGRKTNPVTLHKYIYANNSPVIYSDPTGNFSVMNVAIGVGIGAVALSGASYAVHSLLNSRKLTDRDRVVYLNFDQMAAGGYEKAALQAAIVGKMQRDFASFGVDVKVGHGPALSRSVDFGGSGGGGYIGYNDYGVARYLWAKVFTDTIIEAGTILRVRDNGVMRDANEKEVGTMIGNIGSHEAAHTFGAPHIVDEGYIMAESPLLTYDSLKWSSQTVAFFARRFR